MICRNLERKMCEETAFRDEMVGWLQSMQKTKNGTMVVLFDNIYTPKIINLPDRTCMMTPDFTQQRTMQVCFADNNILLWRMDSWPKKIITGMTSINKDHVMIRQFVEYLQDKLMKFMSMAVEVISVSSEHSFMNDLKMSPSTEHKTSSENGLRWTTDDEIDGYETETNYSDMDVFSDPGSRISSWNKEETFEFQQKF